MKIFNITQKISKNFTLKVFLSFFITLGLMSFAFYMVFITFERHSFEKETVNNGIILTRMLSHSARLPIFAEDLARLDVLITAAFEMEGVTKVCVLNEDKKILAWKNRGASALKTPKTSKAAKNPPVPDHPELLEMVQTKKAPWYNLEEDHIDFWAPVSAQMNFSGEDMFFENDQTGSPAAEKLIGMIEITMNKEKLHRQISEITQTSLLIVGLFLAGGGLISFLLVHSATRPLNELINKISTREGIPQSIKSQDQLGILSGGFDNLLGQLSKTFDVINQLRAGLENKLRELKQEVELRRRVEVALTESEHKARALLNAPIYMAALINPDGIIIDANDTMATTLKVSTKFLTGRNLWEIMPDKELGRTRQEAAEEIICLGEVRHFENQHADNRWYDTFLCPICGAQDQVEMIAVLIRDITAEKVAEKKRQDVEIKALTQSKMASLGQIATGVAHEINQPLSFIKIVYEVAIRDIETNRLDKKELHADFKEALRQVDRIAQLTTHLRTYGRFDTTEFELLNISLALKNTLTLMKERLKKTNIGFVEKVEDNLPLISGNSNKLEQVFINLFQNAIDAMEEQRHGEITVSLSSSPENVIIRFSDTGPGIAPDLTEKIFEPFFTTKPAEKGTGLGLAIIHGIIKEHNGTIACETESGKGTSFVIVLPAERDDTV